jgi:hypothetical protein
MLSILNVRKIYGLLVEIGYYLLNNIRVFDKNMLIS